MRKTLSSLVVFGLALAGCGGGGGTSSPAVPTALRGQASVRIAWPSRGRFVPLAANSVVVTLLQNGLPKDSRVIARPSGDASMTTAAFSGLEYGAYEVAVVAFPERDGSGNAQARGAAPITVTEDVPGTASVSMTTTVARLAILPVRFDKGLTVPVSVSATDADGNVVLLAAGDGQEAIAWSVDPVVNSLGQAVPAATVSGSGPSISLTGVRSGATKVRATLDFGLGVPLVAEGDVTVNAIPDGTGTVTIS